MWLTFFDFFTLVLYFMPRVGKPNLYAQNKGIFKYMNSCNALSRQFLYIEIIKTGLNCLRGFVTVLINSNMPNLFGHSQPVRPSLLPSLS